MSPLWRVWLTVPEDRTAAAERVLEGWADAVSVFELASADRPRPGNRLRTGGWADEIWLAEVCVVEGIAAAPPDMAALARRAAGDGLPAPEAAPLAERDWTAESQAGLPVRRIGRIALGDPGARLPPAPVRLHIAAATAFGTGAHPTTEGCLAALDRLRRRTGPGRRPRAVLDLGTGTGVLAFAAARLWPGVRVAASDIDPAAIAPFARNARANGLRLRVVQADGPAHPALRAAAPYDAILANLLYRPLMRLAPGIARLAAPGGLVVLSGISNARNCRCASRCAGRACVSLARAAAAAGPPSRRSVRRAGGQGGGTVADNGRSAYNSPDYRSNSQRVKPMARVTVEDCVLKVPNRFDLVMLAAQRSRDISEGAEITLDRDRDKNPVVSLREIAEETVPLDELEEGQIRRLLRHREEEEEPGDGLDMLPAPDVPDRSPAEQDLDISSLMREVAQQDGELQPRDGS